jgi:hypothetical protein
LHPRKNAEERGKGEIGGEEGGFDSHEVEDGSRKPALPRAASGSNPARRSAQISLVKAVKGRTLPSASAIGPGVFPVSGFAVKQL